MRDNRSTTSRRRRRIDDAVPAWNVDGAVEPTWPVQPRARMPRAGRVPRPRQSPQPNPGGPDARSVVTPSIPHRRRNGPGLGCPVPSHLRFGSETTQHNCPIEACGSRRFRRHARRSDPRVCLWTTSRRRIHHHGPISLPSPLGIRPGAEDNGSTDAAEERFQVDCVLSADIRMLHAPAIDRDGP